MTTMKALSVLAAAASMAQALDLSSLTGKASASGKASGTAGLRLRDWDCKASPFSPVEVCDVDDNPVPYIGEDGPAFTCSRQHTYAKNSSLAYGFATVVTGTVDAQIAGACYKLTYDVAANATGKLGLAAKTLVVQATNVTDGVGEALFDLAIPGSGIGPFSQQACVEQFSAVPAGYGRCEKKSDCQKLPALLQAACRFRFDWISDLVTPKRDLAGLSSAATGALGTKVNYMRVKCPSELVNKSKFVLADDDSFPAAPSYDDAESENVTEPTEDAVVVDDATPVDDASSADDAAPAEDAAPAHEDESSTYEKRDGPPQQEFAQCGGQGYAGPTNCDQGLSCKDQSPYYSQCMRDVQKLYAQCGGKGFNGPSKCEDGLKCKFVHEKYSQCQPENGPPSTRSVNNSPSRVEARDSAQTLYGQCSGANWKGATECADGLKCFTRDASYGQCLQTLQLKFQQCGGALYVGQPVCCWHEVQEASLGLQSMLTRG